MTYVALGSLRQLQEIGPDDRVGWRPIQGPIDGYRLKMNLPSIRRVGYSTPADLPQAIVHGYGYSGAIRLNKGGVTYLYR